MALTFHPKAGQVLMCDFSGLVSPEMTKLRPVIIVSPNHLPRPDLYAVVPMSTTDPEVVMPYHYLFGKNPKPGGTGSVWAKCDMITTVSIARLDRVKVGRGNYAVGHISKEQLAAVRECVKFALGIT